MKPGKQLFCAQIKRYYARVRIINTVLDPTGNVIELIVLDIDMGTIVTIKPRKLFYLPDELASVEPLGVVVRPSEVCDRAQNNAEREKVQSDLASLLEKLHPKCHIKTLVRQYRESDTIRGPFSDAIIEVKIDGKYENLRNVLECRFPGVFYRERQAVLVAQHRLGILNADLGIPSLT